MSVAEPAASLDGMLVSVLGSDGGAQILAPGAEEGFRKFLLKNNGVLFENDYLQIGVKSEYKNNLGMVFLVVFTALHSLDF